MGKYMESFEAAVSYILEIPRFCAKNDTESTKEFLKLLGTNEKSTVIHVAGTNGKGSVCAFLNSVHMKMGKKTGLFTSPHLVDIRERICIDNKMISKEDFCRYTNAVLDYVDKFNGGGGNYHPSYFEFLFFIAVMYFKDNDTEVDIYETGLGGRLDATNSLPRKNLSVITSIGMDHMEYLGNTLGEIAAEKAGIIKQGVPVAYICGKSESDDVIKKAASDKGVKVYCAGRDSVNILRREEKNIDFSYKYGYDSNVIFSVRTYALYQVDNASLALCALQALYGDDIVKCDEVKAGIADMQWPGRLEKIGPNVFLDGGHNVDGLEALVKSVSEDGCTEKRWLLFSAVSDKQVALMSDVLIGSGLFEEVGICTIDSSRATDIETLKKIVTDSMKTSASDISLKIYGGAGEAYDDMVGRLPDNRVLYICGSLYLVGAVKEHIKGAN